MVERDIETTKVIFRVWKTGSGKGGVIALFPATAATVNPAHCQSYERIGQHGTADYRLVMEATRPATLREYAGLKQHLEQHYRYDLEVRQRETPAMYDARKKQIAEWIGA